MLTCDLERLKLWDCYDFHFRKVGQLLCCLDTIEGLDIWVVANIFSTLRGQGLMRRLLPKLLPSFKRFGSDLSGGTSDEAVAMWKALGARKLPTSRCPKGYIYLLEHTGS